MRKPTPDSETQERLNETLNDILIYATEHLPEGWEITIKMSGCPDRRGDCSISLEDPDGNDVSESWDSDRLNVFSMVAYCAFPKCEHCCKPAQCYGTGDHDFGFSCTNCCDHGDCEPLEGPTK